MITDKKYIIPNLQNACRAMKLLGGVAEGMTVAEACRELEIPQTTALRIFSTLEEEGFVEKSGRRYRLGGALTQLQIQRNDHFDLVACAKPAMMNLAEMVDETAHIAIPSGFKTLIVGVCDSPHPVRATSKPGTLAESHCSAAGKIFINALFADRLDELAEEAPLNARTSKTIVSLPELEAELRTVQKQGYAVDDEEFYDGVRCLAAPVFDKQGKVIASVGITAGTQRFTRKRIPEVARLVIAAAEEISNRVTI